MVLEQIEKQSILDLMGKYKRLHDEIGILESSIRDAEQNLKKLLADKDTVIRGLEENREIESTLIKGLVEKYGEGKLNLENFEWVVNNK